MTKSRSGRGNHRARGPLKNKGLVCIGLGVAMVLAHFFLDSPPSLEALGRALRVPGWLAICAGALLLFMHFLLALQPAAKPAPQTHSDPWGDSHSTGFLNSRHYQRHQNDGFKQRLSDTRPHSGVPDAFRTSSLPAAALAARSTKPSSAAKQRHTAWSGDVFAAIEWRRFEAFCEALFKQAGFRTEAQSHDEGGGLDIWLYSNFVKGPAALAHCKHRHRQTLGVEELREFFGVMVAHQIRRGTYVTSGRLTEEALRFAKDQRINVLDEHALLGLVARRTPEQQQALLAVAQEGEYWRPTCASCGIKLVLRSPGKTIAEVWTCPNYPMCMAMLPTAAATF